MCLGYKQVWVKINHIVGVSGSGGQKQQPCSQSTACKTRSAQHTFRHTAWQKPRNLSKCQHFAVTKSEHKWSAGQPEDQESCSWYQEIQMLKSQRLSLWSVVCALLLLANLQHKVQPQCSRNLLLLISCDP